VVEKSLFEEFVSNIGSIEVKQDERERGMKSRLVLPVVLVVFLVGGILVACGGGDSKPGYKAGQEVTLTGTTKIIDNDGEALVLSTPDGQVFELRGAKEEYQKEGVPIKVVATIVMERSLAVNGPAVTIKEYLEP
jgi:hypothetical protein